MGSKFTNNATPVGVTSSESIGPPNVTKFEFSKIFKVAGAGTAKIPCFVLTVPPPNGNLLQWILNPFWKPLILSRTVATPIISKNVSIELNSCKWMFLINSPWTFASAWINEFKTLLAYSFAELDNLEFKRKLFNDSCKDKAVLWSLVSSISIFNWFNWIPLLSVCLNSILNFLTLGR